MSKPRNIPKLKSPIKSKETAYQIANMVQVGLQLINYGRFDEAKGILENALRVDPHDFDVLQLLGALLVHDRQHHKAVELLAKAIKINPHSAEAYSNHGNVLKELGRLDEALKSANHAIRIKPNYAEAYVNRGNVLREFKHLDDALNSYDKAISIRPDYADAYYNKGVVLHDLGRFEESLISSDRAISIKSSFAEAYVNRGKALRELKCLDEALISYDKAISIKPGYADAYCNRGILLNELGRLDDALKSYDKLLTLEPDYKFALGALQHLKMLLCDWSNFEDQVNVISQKILNQEKCSTPFPIIALIGSAEVNKICSQIYAKEMHPFQDVLGIIPKRSKESKIRVGYFSADFRSHAVSILTAELFELHDKNKFEIIAFSFGVDDESPIRKRLTQAFNQFIDVSAMSDLEIAKLSRRLNIDIAVDLGGYTYGSRTNIFAYRAAPLQVSYIGYLGTMGIEYFDYLIADKTLVPENFQKYYSEKIIYLPCYQVNDRKRTILDREFSRQELDLPEYGFVFCSFNNSYKILPATFDGWMRILGAVKGSVLWLFECNSLAEASLKNEATRRGIDSNRLIFAKRMPLQEHLSRYRQADLFIDTFPCNAGATASDALWAGLPVLTLAGESFASRQAASLLNAIFLPELIANTQEQYEYIAIDLASNQQKLSSIKRKLQDNRLSAPLFDTPRSTNSLEEAYRQIYELYHADLAADYLSIQA